MVGSFRTFMRLLPAPVCVTCIRVTLEQNEFLCQIVTRALVEISGRIIKVTSCTPNQPASVFAHSPFIMASESPQSCSSTPTPRREKPSSPSNQCSSDADIRNFAPVARIMKTALPDNAKIAKEAKECMQECVSEFISFITSEGLFLSTICPDIVVLTTCSVRKMSNGKAKDSQWGRHTLCYELDRL